MISFKDKTSFLLAICILTLINGLSVNNPGFCTPSSVTIKMRRPMQTPKFLMYSSAFKNGERIPTHYTADDVNVSPPLSWGTAPAGTKSFALICEDPDAPMGTWIHWIVYNIPPDKKGLEQGVPAQPRLSDDSQQGINSFKHIGYGGPSPPPGKPHRYFFKLYALSEMIVQPSTIANPPMDAKTFYSYVKRYTLAESDLMGTYGR